MKQSFECYDGGFARTECMMRCKILACLCKEHMNRPGMLRGGNAHVLPVDHGGGKFVNLEIAVQNCMLL